jgi:hypothetical protein
MSNPTGFVVLGPYRSGTSVTSQVLHALGTDFGPKRHLMPATRENPGGYFERRDINRANDALIHSAGKTLADPGHPREIVAHGDRKTLEVADLGWFQESERWGIKDPRMCATLLAWIEFGLLDRSSLRLILVRRDMDAAVHSGMAFGTIRNFADGTEAGVRAMLERYAQLAQWHVDTLQIPTFTLDYEQLIKQPTTTVRQLADFLGVSDAKRIQQATRLIGKGKGMFTLQMERYFIRAPRRLFYLLTGRKRDGSRLTRS